MRRLLSENVRRKKSLKRAGMIKDVALDAIAAAPAKLDLDLLALDGALAELEQKWPDHDEWERSWWPFPIAGYVARACV